MSCVVLLGCYLLAIRGLGLSISYAFVTSLSLIGITLVAAMVFGETLTVQGGIGVVLVISGLLLIARSSVGDPADESVSAGACRCHPCCRFSAPLDDNTRSPRLTKSIDAMNKPLANFIVRSGQPVELPQNRGLAGLVRLSQLPRFCGSPHSRDPGSPAIAHYFFSLLARMLRTPPIMPLCANYRRGTRSWQPFVSS